MNKNTGCLSHFEFQINNTFLVYVSVFKFSQHSIFYLALVIIQSVLVGSSLPKEALSFSFKSQFCAQGFQLLFVRGQIFFISLVAQGSAVPDFISRGHHSPRLDSPGELLGASGRERWGGGETLN